MPGPISEADWKVFRRLHPVALERFCQGVLSEVGRLTSDAGVTAHRRYLDLFQLVRLRDRELAGLFNGLRRSTAFLQLALIRSRGLLTPEELARFSPELREALQGLPGP